MLASQKTKITELFKNALAAVGAPENTKIVLERPKQQSHGDIACTVALQCAKAMKQPPRVIADKLVEELRKETADSEMFSAIEIAGPGFINLKLAPSLKQDVVREILKRVRPTAAPMRTPVSPFSWNTSRLTRPDLFIWAMQDRAH